MQLYAIRAILYSVPASSISVNTASSFSSKISFFSAKFRYNNREPHVLKNIFIHSQNAFSVTCILTMKISLGRTRGLTFLRYPLSACSSNNDRFLSDTYAIKTKL